MIRRNAVLAGFLLLSLPGALFADWSNSTFVSDAGGKFNWIVLDSLGNPHIAHNESSAGIYYTSYSGGWSTQLAQSSVNARIAILGLNAADEPRIVVQHRDNTTSGDQGEARVYYRRKVGSTWQNAEKVTPFLNYYDLGAFYRKGSDQFRAVYFKRNSDSGTTLQELRYSSQTSATKWGGSNVTLDANPPTNNFGTGASDGGVHYDQTAIYQDSAGKVHVAYYDRSTAGPRIKYTRRNDDGTSDIAPEVVTTNVNTQTVFNYHILAIATDLNNIPHLAFSRGAGIPYDIAYTSRNCNGWCAVQIATAAAAQYGTVDIEMDPAGHPVIDYEFSWQYNSGRVSLLHQSCDGGWTASTAPISVANSDEGGDTNMTISTTGVIHVAHFRATPAPNGLLYSKWVDSHTPTAVADLALSAAGSDIIATWTSPPDRGDKKQNQALPHGSRYYIQYGSSSDPGWNPASAQIAIATGCVAPGTPQSYRIVAPSCGPTCHVRVWTRDEYPDNISAVSNAASVVMESDQEPPGAITDLAAAGGPLAATVDLSWTSPGDDGYAGLLGPGSRYLIQYTTDAAAAEAGTIWSPAGAQISIPISAADPGSLQTHTVAGLIMGATYYFRAWTEDESSNYSALSNGATAAATLDELAPQAASDLAVESGPQPHEAALSWLSAGDDGIIGALPAGSQYRIQFTSVASEAQNDEYWSPAAAQIVISTSGAAPNSARSYVVTNLAAATSYYFRLWTADEVPNWSAFSNLAQHYVPADPPQVSTATLYLRTIAPSGFPSGSRALRDVAGAAANLGSKVNPGGAVTSAAFRIIPQVVNGVSLGTGFASLPATVTGQTWIADQDVSGKTLAGGNWQLKVGYKTGSRISGTLYFRLSRASYDGETVNVIESLTPWTTGPNLLANQSSTVHVTTTVAVGEATFAAGEFLFAEYAVVATASSGGSSNTRDLCFEIETSNDFIQVNSSGGEGMRLSQFGGGESENSAAPPIRPAASVATAKAFPNPFMPSRGHALVTFNGLPANARIRIYTLTGERVADLNADAAGAASWNVRNAAGYAVASGVYFVLAQGEGQSRTFKLAVQR